MFIFDYENRLSQAWDRKNRVTYKYDALGRRVAEYAGTRGSTKFTHDGEDVLADDSTVSGVTKYQNGPGIDNKLSVKQGTTTNYFLADHLGSTNALTDSTGVIASQASYDSFGRQTGNLATRYQFTGREYDSFTSLQYSRARFYNPKLGRFISEDPIGFGGGDVNLYGYVSNQPVQNTDPSGNQPQGGLTFLPGGYYGPRWYSGLQNDFDEMRKEGCECRKSFENFGVNLDDLATGGILIGNGDTLNNSDIPDAQLLLTSQERENLASRGGRASTLITGEMDPRPHIFFRPAASRTAWGVYGDPCALCKAFAHELMHAGRVKGEEPNFFQKYVLFEDDLSYLDSWNPWNRPYSKLLSDCGCQ